MISTSEAYPPTTECTVNSPTPTPIKTSLFEGDVSVWIKDFVGEKKGGEGGEYFGKRVGMTYGIVVRGRLALLSVISKSRWAIGEECWLIKWKTGRREIPGRGG